MALSSVCVVLSSLALNLFHPPTLLRRSNNNLKGGAASGGAQRPAVTAAAGEEGRTPTERTGLLG